MQSWLFLAWCFLPVLIVLWSDSKRAKRNAVIKKHIKTNTDKGESDMLKIIGEFIGKKCAIETIDKDYEGVIESVEENWIVVRDAWFETKAVVNLEYVTGIRLCKVKTKKSRKTDRSEEKQKGETAEKAAVQ